MLLQDRTHTEKLPYGQFTISNMLKTQVKLSVKTVACIVRYYLVLSFEKENSKVKCKQGLSFKDNIRVW